MTNTPENQQITDLFTQLTTSEEVAENSRGVERDESAKVSAGISSPAMHLNSLEITNLWSYDYADIGFEDGITVIAGMNGSGKSSLLESIFFALYGSKAGPAMDRPLSDVLRIGESIGSAALKFQYGIHHYTAQMSLKRRGDNVISDKEACRLVRNDGSEWVGVEVATSAVEELFGMNRDDFTNCVYVRQGEIDRLIRAGGRERRDMIDRLLRLEKLDKYARRSEGGARTAVNRHHSKLEGFVMKNRGDLKALESEDPQKQLGELENVIKAKQGELKESDENLDKAKELRQQQSEELKRIESLRHEIDSTKQNLNTKEAQLSDHQTRQQKISASIEELKEKYAECETALSQRLENLEISPQSAIDQIDAIQTWNELAVLTEAMSQVEARQEAIQREAEGLQSDGSKALQRLVDKREAGVKATTESETHLKNANLQLRKMCDLLDQGKCPECGQPIEGGDFTKQIQAKQEEIDKLEATLNELQAEHRELLKKIEAHNESSESKLATLREEYNRLNQQKKLLEESKELTQQLLQIKRDAQERRENLKTLAEMSESIRDEVATLKTKLKENEKKISDVSEVESKAKRLNDVIEKLQAERVKRQGELEELIRERGILESKLEQLEKLRKESESLQVQVEEAKKLQAELNSLSAFYGDLKTELRKENIKALEHYFNEFFHVMDSGASYSRVSIDKEYDIVVELKDGGSIRPELLSGGERALINIALRSAIHQVLSQATNRMPLILDEPTIYLDRDRIIRLQYLLEALGSRISQVIVVSHEAGLVEGADHEYRTEKRADNTSHVYQIR